MRVRIIGAGIAGLACAVALRRRCGLEDVLVAERDTPEAVQGRAGHGLILMQNGVAALRALGADGVLDGYRTIDAALFQDERGLVVRAEAMDGVYCVTHSGLTGAFRAVLPEGAVACGRRFTGVDLVPPLPAGRDPRTIRRHVRSVTFGEGTAWTDADADLFVGADGWRSRMYAACNPEMPRAHSPTSRRSSARASSRPCSPIAASRSACCRRRPSG